MVKVFIQAMKNSLNIMHLLGKLHFCEKKENFGWKLEINVISKLYRKNLLIKPD